MNDSSATQVHDLAERLETAVASVFIGSRDVIRQAVTGLLGSLHILIEDIPGVGKTTLALALAKSAGLSFSRIQFTPDMLPGDVLGMQVWDQSLHDFVWKDGPVNAQFILADELNRTSPRTQAAFLEAMQDGAITIQGETKHLPQPFFMIGTQNPESFTGTFPLPEAELDRFGLSFSIGYPSPEGEAAILSLRHDAGKNTALDTLETVASADDIVAARRLVSDTHISDLVREYIVSLVRSSRSNDLIRIGASPRAAIFLQQAAKARAAIEGRNFVMPEDVDAMAESVLAHRILLSSKARIARQSPAACVRTLVAAQQKPAGV